MNNFCNNDRFITPIFLVLASLFVTCLLISNIIAGKLMFICGFVLPTGAILFPITYLFGDVLTEVYGYKRTRLVIWIGFACNILMAVVFLIVIALPYPSFWQNQNAYETVLGMTPRLVIASLISYWLGEFLNSTVMSIMKKLTHGKWLWTRTLGSTIIGQAVDTTFFIGIAFYLLIPDRILIQMIIAQYIWKIVYETVATPLTYIIVARIKKAENLNTFDWGVKYNPFRLELK